MRPEPNLVIDPASPVPVYRQVVDNLRSLLVEGVLQEGDSLPTVRELGMELGVHFNTIAEAYRQLAAEGWLELKRRRGAVVMARSTPVEQPEVVELFQRNLRQLVAQGRADGVSNKTITRYLKQMMEELSA